MGRRSDAAKVVRLRQHEADFRAHDRHGGVGGWFLSFSRLFLNAFGLFAIIGAAVKVLEQQIETELAVLVQDEWEILEWENLKNGLFRACHDTLVASWRWIKLLESLVLPVSYCVYCTAVRSFEIVQPLMTILWGFLIALKPVMILTWAQISKASPVAKLSFLGFTSALIFVFFVRREIVRRKYISRARSSLAKRKSDCFKFCSDTLQSLRQKSRLLADLIPHVLFLLLPIFFVLWFGIRGDWSGGDFVALVVMFLIPLFCSIKSLVVFESKYFGLSQDLYHRYKDENSNDEGNWHESYKIKAHQLFARFFDSSPTQDLNLKAKVTEKVASERNHAMRKRRNMMSSYTDSPTKRNVHGFSKLIDESPSELLELYEPLISVMFWLKYWTLTGILLLVDNLPLSGHLVALLPRWTSLRTIWCIWLQFPGTMGTLYAFHTASKLIDKVVGVSPRNSTVFGGLNQFLNGIFAIGLISDNTRAKASEILASGGSAIIFFLSFFFFPASIARIGAILLGIGRPVISTTEVLLFLDCDENAFKSKLSDNEKCNVLRSILCRDTQKLVGVVRMAQWTKYWVVYCIIFLFQSRWHEFLMWIPLYTQILLLATLFLQIPYFEGANRVFDFLVGTFFGIHGNGMFRSAFVANLLNVKENLNLSESSRIMKDIIGTDETNADRSCERRKIDH